MPPLPKNSPNPPTEEPHEDAKPKSNVESTIRVSGSPTSSGRIARRKGGSK